MASSEHTSWCATAQRLCGPEIAGGPGCACHEPLRCRTCGDPATVSIRSGLEWHPTCDECASWWGEHRHGPLSEVEPGYVYEPHESDGA